MSKTAATGHIAPSSSARYNRANGGRHVDRLERFRGCLVGLAVGDALGAPVEGLSRAEIEAQHGRVTDMLGGGWLGLQPGVWTDDTGMMLCIARSIVEKGGFDPEDTAYKFLEWFDADPVDVGQTTWVAMEALSIEVPWNDAGRMAHARLGGLSAGNGSIMRCAPIGLLDAANEQQLVRDSLDSSVITHWDPRACWGAVAVNLAVAHALEHGKERLLDDIVTKIEQPDVRKAVTTVAHMGIEDVVPSTFVLDTLQAALWCFLNADSFEEALVDAVNLGGDADTVGAVCGSMAGACYGLEAIPQRWREPLACRSEILELADGIYRLARG